MPQPGILSPTLDEIVAGSLDLASLAKQGGAAKIKTDERKINLNFSEFFIVTGG